jgi:uncharacterized membrane protein YfcA
LQLSDILILVIAGLGAGYLAGLLGVGGGILLVPVLRMLAPSLGLPESHSFHTIVATSMAVVVPTALRSAYAHAARGSVDAPLFKTWAPSLALGAFIAGFMGGMLSTLVLSLVFASVASLLGLRFLMTPATKPTAETSAKSTPLDPITSHKAKSSFISIRALFGQNESIRRARMMGLGAVIGALAAWMGIGGGTLLVPTFQALRIGMHRAVGTSAALGIVVATPALIGWIISGWSLTSLAQGYLGFVNLYLLAVLLPCALSAAPWGVRMAHRLPDYALKRAFGCFLVVASVLIIIKAAY